MGKKMMILLACLIFASMFCLGGCFEMPVDEVLASLGDYTHKEFYTSGGFQDFTDYAKYHYDDVDLKDNPYLKQVNDENISEFYEYLESFEGWVHVHAEDDPENELVREYDFNTDVISEDDYVYVKNNYDGDNGNFRFSDYDIYFFDSQSKILYFFHNNI